MIDRFWFRSIYFREPSGVLFEIATLGPGFGVDEDPEHLGEKLILPPFLEDQREQIEAELTPVANPRRARRAPRRVSGPSAATLVHRLREPAGEPEGALILNHGRGADENDLFGLLDELDPERRLLGVTTGAPLTDDPAGRPPLVPGPAGRLPRPGHLRLQLRALTGFLDGLLAERGIAWERTVIGGFSMGAVMSYAVGLGTGRPSPAAILAFSGFIPTVEGWRPELERARRACRC